MQKNSSHCPTLPVTAVQISWEICKDKVSSRLFALILSGDWTASKDVKLFVEKRNVVVVAHIYYLSSHHRTASDANLLERSAYF